MKKPKTKLVQLRMTPDLLAFLKERVKGTNITLTTYVNALLTVGIIDLINRGRAEDNRTVIEGRPLDKRGDLSDR